MSTEALTSQDLQEERYKEYIYYKDDKKQIIKRSWVNKGENKAKKEIMKSYFENAKLDLDKHTVKYYYKEFAEKNKSLPISFSMFYKYFVNDYIKVNYKERPNLWLSAKSKDRLPH